MDDFELSGGKKKQNRVCDVLLSNSLLLGEETVIALKDSEFSNFSPF